MSTIFATRRGFLYQDVYAVLEFLKFFQSKEIAEFYVDFTIDLAYQRSVDVKIVLKNNLTKIVEIKSGQNFKQDKRKKDSSEIRDAFLEFVEYQRLNGDALMVFALSPEFKEKPRIFEYWQKLINIHNTSSFNREAKRLTRWLYYKLRIPQFSNHEELYRFVRNLDIVPGDTDSCDNPNDPYSDIEDRAIQKIRDICCDAHFQAGVTEPELPCDLLYFDLIYTCQKNAGNKSNICPQLTDKILKFVARRKMMLELSRNIEPYYQTARANFSAWMSEITTPPQTDIRSGSEGGITNGQ